MAVQHVSMSEQQPQRPVLHLSDILADVWSAGPVHRKSVQQAPRVVLLFLKSHVSCQRSQQVKPAARRVADLCDTSSVGVFDLYEGMTIVS